MSGQAASKLVLALLLIGVLTSAYNIQPALSNPGTITVPDDYSTIQEAINAADPGDTILVRSDTYYENVVVNKTLSLTGEDEETTFIDGNRTGPVVKIAANNVSVRGFTIQNGDAGISVIGNYGGHNISQSIIANNTRGIYHVASSNNIISQNNITDNNNGVWFSSSSNNTLSGNLLNDNKYAFNIIGEELHHFLHSIDDSNLVNGKPVYYLVSQTNLVLNPASHPEVGYLGLVNCHNSTVAGLTLSDNVQGLLLAHSNNSGISGNNITNNNDGIWLSSSSNNTLSENNITSNDSGIKLIDSPNNILSGNNITNNNDGIWLSSSSNNTLSENNMADSKTGIYFSSSTNNRILGNNIFGDNMTSTRLYGIDFLESSNNAILGNNITNYNNGIYLYNSSDNSISESSFAENTIGIYLDYSSGNSISENSLANNTIGVNLDYSSNYNSILRNTLTNNSDGADLFESSHNTIFRNNITNNNDGIWLLESTNNTLSENNITTNTNDGIVLDRSSNNTFFHNNLIDNAGQQVASFTSGDTNTWDNGYSSGGNYWSDYSGIDEHTGPHQNMTGSDGIGDFPYVIDIDNQDNYPLMNPYSPPPLHFLAILSSPPEVTFTVDGVSHTTPWSGAYGEGTSVSVVMPEIHDKYVWFQWLEDEDPNVTRTIIVSEDTTLTGVFALDTTPPTISLMSPENRTYPAMIHFPLIFQVNESASWIGYSLNGQMNATINGNTTILSLSEGVHTLTVYASDTVGNVGQSDIIFFTIQSPENDTVPPRISVLAPENKTYATADSQLAFTVDEPVTWIAYSLDKNANMTITDNITLSDLSSGPHTLVIYASDVAGNTGASDVIHFSVEIPEEEFFPTWILAVIAVTSIAGMTLLVYFLRIRKKTGKAS